VAKFKIVTTAGTGVPGADHSLEMEALAAIGAEIVEVKGGEDEMAAAAVDADAIYGKGRPPKKVRERDGETEYEDWIYGEPPQDVDFVRLVGDEVLRVETIRVNGEKVLRTEKEVSLEQPTLANGQEPGAHPVNLPTLRRPGEERF